MRCLIADTWTECLPSTVNAAFPSGSLDKVELVQCYAALAIVFHSVLLSASDRNRTYSSFILPDFLKSLFPQKGKLRSCGRPRLHSDHVTCPRNLVLSLLVLYICFYTFRRTILET